MENFSNIDTLFIVMAFIVPGYILSHVRNQFMTGRENQGAEQFIRYLTLSLFNYAVFSWLIYIILTIESEHSILKLILWLLLLLLCPTILGVISGIAIQRSWIYKFLKRIGLNPVHTIPSAWDWKFGNMEGSLVLITLNDNTKYAGWCSDKSCISSDPSERDIFLEQMYDIDDNDEWIDRGNDSVLICSNNIKTIEFIDQKKGELR